MKQEVALKSQQTIMFPLISCMLYLHYLLSIFCIVEGAVTLNVANFGAKSDGRTDATEPFSQAWTSACSSTEPTTIYVPNGLYMINSIEFRGPCTSPITVQIDGSLVAPTDYRALSDGYWILFIKVNQLSVIGGFFDANGERFWACKTSGQNCPAGARSITFNWVNDGEISGITSVNSQLTHLVINSCNNVKVDNVKLIAPDLSPNTDGIHVQSSTGVTITDASIKTGDDCISIGPGTKDLWIESIQCGPGHGVSIGSLGRDFEEDGVQNVTLVNSIFTASDNGMRIKTWARPSTGFVRNINYRNIVMTNVENPIIIDQNYCPSNQGCPTEGSGIKINQVTYQNIQGTSATAVAMAFDCSPTNPCGGIVLQDIKLTYLNTGRAQSVCNNVDGTSGGLILPESCL